MSNSNKNPFIQIGSLSDVRWNKIGMATFGCLVLVMLGGYLGYTNSSDLKIVTTNQASNIKLPTVKITNNTTSPTINSPISIDLKGENIPSESELYLKYSALDSSTNSNEITIKNTFGDTSCLKQGSMCIMHASFTLTTPGEYMLNAYIMDKNGHIVCGNETCFVNATQNITVK